MSRYSGDAAYAQIEADFSLLASLLVLNVDFLSN